MSVGEKTYLVTASSIAIFVKNYSEERLLANHKSALKRHRQSEQRAARNRAGRTRVKNVVKAVRAALLEKNPEKASAALITAASVLDKTAGKGIIHWKNAARKISRLTKAVNAAKANEQ